MDGMELLEAVKAGDKQAVVIVITGYGTIESAVKAIKNGAYDYITKPVKMEELEVIIDRALDRYALSKQLGLFKGLTLALIISVPLWLILGIVLALLWKWEFPHRFPAPSLPISAQGCFGYLYAYHYHGGRC